MAPLTLHLLRHGKVENPANLRYGRRPGFGLSHRGWLQAHQARRFLADQPVEIVFTSPLVRATETAAIVNQSHHAPTVVTERLNEIDDGEPSQQVRRRMRQWLYAVAFGGYRQVLAVGHYEPFRVLVLDLVGRFGPEQTEPPAERLELPTGGIIRIHDALSPRPSVELIHRPTD